jgi:HEAT repeat protein
MDALIEALAHVSGARGTQALARLMPLLGKLGRAKLAEAFGAHADAGPALVGLLADADPGVRANAAWSLGSVGSAADMARLSALRDDPDIAVAANSIAAVASIAARERVDAAAVLCAALDDARSMVLANALAGLRRLALSCPKPEVAAWLLEHHPSDEVRLTAARLLRDRWAAIAPQALARCAAKDVSGLVALECTAPAADETALSWQSVQDVGVLVVPTGATAPTPRAPFALVRADGFIRSGTSDRRGAVWEAAAPRGPLRLTLPAVFAE